MKHIRFISLFLITLMLVHGAGITRTLHNLTHHSSNSTSSTIDHAINHGDHTHESHSESDHQPSPEEQNDSHDCELCLSLSTSILSESSETSIPEQSQCITIALNSRTLCAPQAPSIIDGPARAPPRA